MPSRNVQLIGGDVHDSDLAALFDGLDPHKRIALRRLHAHRGVLRHHFGVGLCLFLRQHLSLRVRRQKHSELHFVNVTIGLEVRRGLLIPKPFDAASLEHEPILGGGVEDQEAVVLLVEDMIAGVGCLLCALHIFRADRIKDHCLIGAGEHLHQIRQHPLHCVEHIRRHHLAAAF